MTSTPIAKAEPSQMAKINPSQVYPGMGEGRERGEDDERAEGEHRLHQGHVSTGREEGVEADFQSGLAVPAIN